jgi:hypothetical protein
LYGAVVLKKKIYIKKLTACNQAKIDADKKFKCCDVWIKKIAFKYTKYSQLQPSGTLYWLFLKNGSNATLFTVLFFVCYTLFKR